MDSLTMTPTPITTSTLFRPFIPFPSSPTTPPTTTTTTTSKPPPHPTSHQTTPIQTPSPKPTTHSSPSPQPLFRPFLPKTQPTSPILTPPTTSPLIPQTRRQDRIETKTTHARNLSTLSNKSEGWIGNSRRFRSDGDIKGMMASSGGGGGGVCGKRGDSPRWGVGVRGAWKPVRFRRVVDDGGVEGLVAGGDRVVKPVAVKGVVVGGGGSGAGGSGGVRRVVGRSGFGSFTEGRRRELVKVRRRCQSVDFDGLVDLMGEKGRGFYGGLRNGSDLSGRGESPVSVESSYGSVGVCGGERLQSMNSVCDVQHEVTMGGVGVISKRAVSSVTPRKSEYLQQLLANQDAMSSESNSSSESTVYEFGTASPVVSSMRDFDAFKETSVRGSAASSYSVLNHLPRRRSRIFRSFNPLKSATVSPKDLGNADGGAMRMKQGRGGAKKDVNQTSSSSVEHRSDRKIFRFLKQSFNRQSRKLF